MKVAIYLPGLGEAFEDISVVRYAELLANEIDQNNNVASISYKIKVEKVKYATDENCSSNKVSIISNTNGSEKTEYIIYDFCYSALLTEEFKSRNILMKSFLLLWVVITKFPLLILRIFSFKKGFSLKFRLQSLWAIFCFLIIALLGITLIPGSINLLKEVSHTHTNLLHLFHYKWMIRLVQLINTYSKWAVAIVAIIFSLTPSSKDVFTSLATEFVAANYYLEMGERKQIILGHLQKLLEHISETEGEETKIHFHSYSFGSVIAIDFLFPYGNILANRTKQMTEAMITIGCPYDFFSTYYNGYFTERVDDLKGIKWYNVYSIVDALGSNFRDNNDSIESTYSFINGFMPLNFQYELNHLSKSSFSGVIMFYFIRAHKLYWDKTSTSESCIRLFYTKMHEDGLI